jgi:hypothetical protein
MGLKLRKNRKEDNGLLHGTRFHSTSIIPSTPHGITLRRRKRLLNAGAEWREGVGCGRYPIPPSAL